MKTTTATTAASATITDPSPAACDRALQADPAGRAELELRALLDAAVDAVIVIDHEGRIETFSRAAERLFGYDAADVLGRNVTLLMPDPYRTEHDSYLHRYLRTGEAHIIGIGREVSALRRDGSVFPMSLSVGRIAGASPPRFIGFIHDITTRRATMDALRRERDRAQSYLDLAEIILLALDGNGRIALVNRKGCEILGYTEAELVGADWVEQCLPERQRAAARAALAAVLAGERAPQAYSEDYVLARDGTSKLIAWRSTLMRDELGRGVGTLSSGDDVTERRRAERALQQSEALLRAAQEIANLGNYEVRVPHGPAYWSEQVFRIIGRDATRETLGPDEFAASVVHPDDRERFRREFEHALTSSGGFELEYRIVRPDGTVREVHSLAQVSPAADGGSHVITGTLHDVTERKRAEEEMRKSHDRLTHVARLSTMGEMATGLAHEINQPLTAIASYAQASLRLLAAPAGPDPADLREALTQITAQALRAGEVIRRLRGFVKNRATHTETLDLNRLIEDLRVLAEPDARLSDVRLKLDLAPLLPPVAGDPIQIQQVLLNLLRNAIDATLERRGALREITVRTRSVPAAVEVAVVDHGAGVPVGIAGDLFNPFFTTKPEGTGLGLAISRSIIRAHSGKLGHGPTPGGGTTFSFTLPALPGG